MNSEYSNIDIKTIVIRQNVDFLTSQMMRHKETTAVQTVKPTTKSNHVFFLFFTTHCSIVW